MALQKQPVNINFAQGLDTKTDPKQVSFGKFLDLQNSVFQKGGLLQKRNGYGALASLGNATSTFLTTFNGNLTAIGTSFNAYSSGSSSWVNRGSIQPMLVDTLPLIRSNTNQSQCDCAIASNGLVCTVFTDNIPSGGSTVASYKYAIADSVTGQNIVSPRVIPVSSGTVTGSPRVFFLGNYFVIVFSNNVSGTYHLQYVAINATMPATPTAEVDISTSYTPATTVAWDGYVANNSLYLAWNGSDGGGAVRVAYLSSTLALSNTVVFTGHVATIMSVTADLTQSTPVIWASFYDSGGSTGYSLAVAPNLSTILAQTQIISSGTVANITSVAQNSVLTIYYEISANYSYDGAIPTHYLRTNTVTQAGVVGSSSVFVRSVGLASKAFLYSGSPFLLAAYQSSNQPTYFLLNSTGGVVAKIAYSNGGGYLILGLPNVTLNSNVAQVPYLFKDLVVSVNKTQGATVSSAVYAQKGINLASFTIGTSDISVAEIGENLNLSGGILWAYDGYVAVEQGFHVWPDNVEVTTSGAGGSITAQAYFYQVIYEWTDNQGNIFRSAPSIPVTVTTTGATSTNTINVPTLRLTYKTANPVKLVVFRWSTAQQTYYQVTSITVPTLNDPTVDSIAITDTLADSSIIGNSILYTTGGIVENIGPPCVSGLTLFKSRLVAIDAEDKNILWYSKQVIESTPVEMSDLFTLYIAPTNSAQGSTGTVTALSAMDDKLIIFKRDAIYYVVGNGPDSTGANNDFSDPVFITSTVGCTNQRSIVFTPQGLMFQSSKGIWLLGRDLQTTYIGAPVEDFNDFEVQSAVNVPATNQIRFTLSNGKTLMYDYYYNQWGTFVNLNAISSTIYGELHTYLNDLGQVFQETPGSYYDGSNPVLMSFKTGWINPAGLQGYQRAYFLYLLGDYISPHKLSVGIAYDYADAVEQTTAISPYNNNPVYGGAPFYGDGTYGGTLPLEQWQVFLQRQRCQAFQIQLQEVFDASIGLPAGAGFTLSGMNLVIGVKAGKPPLRTAQSVG